MRCVKAPGHYAILSETLLLQLHFKSFPNAHLVPEEVTPYVAYYDFIGDKMSIREEVEEMKMIFFNFNRQDC